jgi:MoxR-like ATPase
VFTQILLADEINRASPRTQSALLEAMAEGQVSVEGKTHSLGELFFVIATQNPVEFRGTYPLPEAQMDRFALRLSLGYVPAEQEVAILTAQAGRHPLEALAACATVQDVLALRDAARQVRVSAEIKRYIVELVRATRIAPQVQLGAGPRASLALVAVAQTLALADGEEYVRPEHVRGVAVAVLAHRLVLMTDAKFAGVTTQSVVEDLLASVPVPA